MKARYLNPKVYDLYYDGPPEYLRRVTREKVIIKVDGGWEGVDEHIVTMADVAEYYAHEAGNIVSGCRTLGKITGDWRNIDALAKECLEIFKCVNLKGIRRESRKLGLVPKF